MRVAIQGTHGSFSEAAARRRWPDLVTLPCREAKDVVAAVRAGEAEAGCLPIENSLIGSVTTTYDLLEEAFGDGTLRLTHEILYPVHHTHHGACRARGSTGIKRVLSHPVALGQCRIWLSEHLPDVELVSAWDTAGSAEMVAQEGNPALAAIAARHAADAHGLVPLAERIEDDPTNQTRFLTFTRADAPALPAGQRGHQPLQDLAHRADRPQAGHARAHAAGVRRPRRQPDGAAVAARALGAVDLPLLRGHRRLRPPIRGWRRRWRRSRRWRRGSWCSAATRPGSRAPGSRRRRRPRRTTPRSRTFRWWTAAAYPEGTRVQVGPLHVRRRRARCSSPAPARSRARR